jgi:hypothetical protein
MSICTGNGTGYPKPGMKEAIIYSLSNGLGVFFRLLMFTMLAPALLIYSLMLHFDHSFAAMFDSSPKNILLSIAASFFQLVELDTAILTQRLASST